MKETIKEHAARFPHIAAEYGDSQSSNEYRACVSPVIRYADPSPEDVVLDLDTGTDTITLALAPGAKRVVGRDISEGMLKQARTKAAEVGIEDVEFNKGRFRDPSVGDDEQIDIVVMSFTIHHLPDEEKHEAIGVIADLEPRRFVLDDAVFFGTPNPNGPFYSPEVGDPATVGFLADAFTDAGFVLTAVESVHEQVNILAAE